MKRCAIKHCRFWRYNALGFKDMSTASPRAFDKEAIIKFIKLLQIKMACIISKNYHVQVFIHARLKELMLKCKKYIN